MKCSGKLPFSEISFKDLLQMARYNPGPASLNSNQGAIQNMLQIMQHVDSSGPLPKDAQHLGEEYSQGQYNPHPTHLQNQYQYNQPQSLLQNQYQYNQTQNQPQNQFSQIPKQPPNLGAQFLGVNVRTLANHFQVCSDSDMQSLHGIGQRHIIQLGARR